MKKTCEYTFSVGTADEERTNIQNRLCNPYTERFFLKYLPNMTGKKILDLGCGTGILTCLLAKIVGPTGMVTAVDVSSAQLNIAKRNAELTGLSNIEFIELNAHELSVVNDSFDLVYCRFLLMHLSNQEDLLIKMMARVKPGGYLCCEEVLSYDAFFADPYSNAFQAWKDLVLKQPQIYKTDYYIGKRLNSLFYAMGLQNIMSEICQPVIRDERDKGYFYLGFTDSVKQKFIEAGIANLAQLDKILDDLKNEMLGKNWVSSAVQHLQILGQKKLDR